jgi:hypothetical protein
MDEVGDPRPTWVFDDDAVAEPELSLERALDRVERPARDGDITAESVVREVRPRSPMPQPSSSKRRCWRGFRRSR